MHVKGRGQLATVSSPRPCESQDGTQVVRPKLAPAPALSISCSLAEMSVGSEAVMTVTLTIGTLLNDHLGGGLHQPEAAPEIFTTGSGNPVEGCFFCDTLLLDAEKSRP
ncbi:hypothetical protein STEG23_013075 [Scotinomys teguina]